MLKKERFQSLSLITLTACLLAFSMRVEAQFNTMSGEKSSTLWTEIMSSHYRIIYPEGYDSLGNRYATLMEYYRPLVGYSAGYLPNQNFNTSMPIVLHPFTATTNGFAALAPRRIEVFTFSDPYSSLPPVSWERLISIHENRHAAQFQFATTGFWRGFRRVFGEVSPLIVDALHLNPAIAEGDAVAVETSLTSSGRGRTADFLSYYRMAFDNGDMRNWYRWRYGSQKFYTPDYYRVGYMTVAGVRYLYDAPMFTSDYLHKIAYPFKFNAMSSTMRKYSGKNFNNTWADITNAFASTWRADDRERGPFQQITPIITGRENYYTSYSGTVEIYDGSLLSVRSALDKSQELVRIMSDGSVSSIRAFNTDSKLAYSPITGCIYWSEAVPDIRWEMYGSSPIRMMNVEGKKISNFTQNGRYVNPTVSDDGEKLAAVEYPLQGGCRIVLFDLIEGVEINSISVDSHLQVNEVAFIGPQILFTGVNDDGMGLYLTDFSTVVNLESPVPFKVHDLISHNGVVYFTSDRNGTEEIYSYTLGNGQNGRNGSLKQLTNTKYGASRPFFRGGQLCFTALLPQGRTPSFSSDEFMAEVSYSEHAVYPIADRLTEQENQCQDSENQYLLCAPSRYSKVANLFNGIHSWMPVYASSDAITGSMTGFLNETVALGAKAFFQNSTSTLSGSVGFSLNVDPFESYISDNANESVGAQRMRTAMHVRLNYTGLFPVFSIAFDTGSRKPVNTVMGIDSEDNEEHTASTINSESNFPFFMGGSMTVSLPLNFSSGGWERYVTPFAGVIASSDRLGENYHTVSWNRNRLLYEITGPADDKFHNHVRYTAGVTGYLQLPVPSSAVFPRYGIGGGVQYSCNPFSSAFYASVYGYLPGMTSVQGLKLSASMQIKSAALENALTDTWAFDMYEMSPRGFISSDAESFLQHSFMNTFKLGVDYAMPILPVELSVGNYFYVRNLELNPFFDYLMVENGKTNDNLYSAGTDLLFRFEKFLFINNTVKIGLRYSYNGGSLFDEIGPDQPHYLGLVSGVSF